jgi:hypothetical protein
VKDVTEADVVEVDLGVLQPAPVGDALSGRNPEVGVVDGRRSPSGSLSKAVGTGS